MRLSLRVFAQVCPLRGNTRRRDLIPSLHPGEPKGYEYASSARRPKSEAEVRCDQLTEALAKAQEENANLRAQIAALELRLAGAEGNPKTRQSLQDAQMIDSLVNG